MIGPLYTTKEMLARLVAFDTTSDKSNLALVSFVEEYLTQHGIRPVIVPSAEGDKASIFATIGPPGTGGVALSGHTDVVPVAGQAWDTHPFTLVERDGRLFGRGTTDMKGYVACVLAAVPAMLRRRLKVPIHIVLSYDEEIGCVGVRPTIARLGKDLVRPRIVLVGEPTLMTVVDAHKGPMRWHVEVTGRAAHSSMAPLGVNAITHAGRLLGELDRMEKDLMHARRDPRFDPPYTTLQVTRLEGGTASNIVPVSCWFGWEVRALPGYDPRPLERRLADFAAARCLPDMQRIAPEAGIRIERGVSVPAFGAGEGSEAVSLALKLAQQNTTHAVSYATEAGLFQDAGSASIVCGPGDIAQAHTANEWIAASELEKCGAFIERLLDWAEK